jgi:hypothetical protein
MSEFSNGYSPGGMTPKQRRHWTAVYNGRKGGRKSGIKRRQLAQEKRRTRDGGLGVPKAYPRVPRLSGERLEGRYRALCALEGRRSHEQGCATFVAVYLLVRRWYDAKGQGFECTNKNLSEALERRGLPHSRRTIQYTRRRLERAGLIKCAHVRRSGSLCIPGQMDTVRVHLLRRGFSKDCTPPLRGTTKEGLRPSLLRGGAPEGKKTNGETNMIPPATPAETETAAATPPATEEQRQLEAQIAFIEAQIAGGWGGAPSRPRLLAKRTELRRQLRQSQAPAGCASPVSPPPAPSDRDSASSSRAPNARADRVSPRAADLPSAARTPSCGAGR